MNDKILKLEKILLSKKNSAKAKILSHYFKTGTGEYGEGDIFLGISVVDQRKIITDFIDLSLSDLQKLLNSKYHEFRLTALLILVKKYQKFDDLNKKKIIDFYLKNIKNINNWDLVDVSCYNILGQYLFDKDRKILYTLAKSNNLWSRRIAVISTFYFIKNNDLTDIFKLAQFLMKDEHDLMHKAIGWMLREAGKKDDIRLKKFLIKNIKNIPRTTLRYAIEKFPEKKRREFLKK
ncbi:MAG: DNA alkylation repair protein [Patescibacteria group bacterium]|nr:DNA alkylation repair protein [Patescibacteria group bacterium]